MRWYLTQIIAKMSICLCQTAVKFNFWDKIYVGDHLERFESVEERTEKGERGQEREFTRLCVFHVLIYDLNNSKHVHFNSLKVNHLVHSCFLLSPSPPKSQSYFRARQRGLIRVLLLQMDIFCVIKLKKNKNYIFGTEPCQALTKRFVPSLLPTVICDL